jgi:hypothetical protein
MDTWMDIVATGYQDDDIVWYHNMSPDFIKYVIDSSFNGPNEVVCIDVDGDNDIDVVSSAQGADEIAWWESIFAGVSESAYDAIPSTIKLACFPNPFHDMTEIHLLGDWERGRKGEVEIQIYDVSGGLVESVKLTTGTCQLGAELKAGVYFAGVGNSPKQKIVKVK